MIETAAVVGSTSQGTVLAVLLARNGVHVRFWALDEADAETLRRDGENARLQPGLRFPPSLSITCDRAAALERSDLVIVAVPPPSSQLVIDRH